MIKSNFNNSSIFNKMLKERLLCMKKSAEHCFLSFVEMLKGSSCKEDFILSFKDFKFKKWHYLVQCSAVWFHKLRAKSIFQKVFQIEIEMYLKLQIFTQLGLRVTLLSVNFRIIFSSIVSFKCQKNICHNFSSNVLFCPTTAQKTFSLWSHETKKSRKLSQSRSWNQRLHLYLKNDKSKY